MGPPWEIELAMMIRRKGWGSSVVRKNSRSDSEEMAEVMEKAGKSSTT
jgi:hypothetical protein